MLGRDEIEEGLLRVERGGHEAPGAENLAVARFDADRAPALHNDALWRATGADLAAVGAHRAFQRPGQRAGAAECHLGLGRTGQQGGDVMAEAGRAQVHLAQAVEEQQPRLDHRMFELAQHEFERRQPASLEQKPPLGARPQQAFALWLGQGRALGLR
jgi:hypothetical protein